MAERHARLVLRKQIVAGIFSSVRGSQIAGQIMIHELRPIRVEAIYSVGLAKSIVDRAIECGGGHKGAEFGDWIGQTQTFRHLSGGLEIHRRKVPVDLE